MAQYATAQNVLDRYESDAEPGTVAVHLDDAERLLRRFVPDLDARVGDGRVDAEDVRYVLVVAVRRYLRNPEGLTFETAGDRSVNRGAGTDPRTAGEIIFTPAELAAVRGGGDQGVRGTVMTPRPGAPVPARYLPYGRWR